MPKINRAADESTLSEWMNPKYRVMILSDPDFLRQLLDLAIKKNQLEEILLCEEDPDSSNASAAYNNAITMHHVESLMLLLDYSKEHFKKYPAIASNVLNLLVEDYLEHREDFHACTQRALAAGVGGDADGQERSAGGGGGQSAGDDPLDGGGRYCGCRRGREGVCFRQCAHRAVSSAGA